MRLRRLWRVGIAVAIAAVFVLWNAPLLTPYARIRGWNSDSAVLGLMGKKILDGRGFDIFFWGQNYIGPLTSILTAAWGGTVLALRLAVMTEVLAGIVLVWWGVDRIDSRAAAATGFALALTPPVVERMIVRPLGAEMAFALSAALFAFVMQDLTSPRGEGWLSRRGGQFAFGLLAGIAWWMNQQVVFVLIAAALVLGYRWIDERPSIRDLATMAAGAVLGYAPVWAGAIFGWYERSYVFGFRPIYPEDVPARVREFLAAIPQWTGIADNGIGIAYAIVIVLFIVSALAHMRTAARVFLFLIPFANAAFYLGSHRVEPHYLITSAGMLIGFAAIGATDLPRMRAALPIAALIAFASIAISSRAVQNDEVLREPDPMPLLERVRDARCSVVYADYWIAYRYRFLDGEQRAWIPYRSLNRNRAESREFQKRPGQRCLVTNDGNVDRIDRVLPLVNPPVRPSASPRPARPPAAH